MFSVWQIFVEKKKPFVFFFLHCINLMTSQIIEDNVINLTITFRLRTYLQRRKRWCRQEFLYVTDHQSKSGQYSISKLEFCNNSTTYSTWPCELWLENKEEWDAELSAGGIISTHKITSAFSATVT